MTSPARIREAREEDAAAIARVHIDTWRAAYRGIVADEFLDRLSYERSATHFREVFMSPQSRDWVFVAEDDHGEVIGFACGGPVREADPAYKGELYAIYLLPQHHRRGIGRALTAAVVGKLLDSGITTMLIWALAANPSRMFYESLGGRRLREREITIGGAAYIEVAYGWDDITPLAPAR